MALKENNVNLWFALSQDNKITVIEDADYNTNYTCPICANKVIPKAIKKDSLIASHFAHIDSSKCSQESQLHWWTKHKLLECGDKFSIVIGDNIRKYVVEETSVEKSINYSSGIYRPDLIVKTICGEEIYFEIMHTNKKDLNKYYDIFSELNKTVVQVDIKNINGNNIFKTIYHEGFIYTKQKSKELKFKEDYSIRHRKNIESVKRVNWMISNISKYNTGEITIGEFSEEFSYLTDDEKEVIFNFMRLNCTNIYKNYFDYKYFFIWNVILRGLSDNHIDFIKHELSGGLSPNSYCYTDGFNVCVRDFSKIVTCSDEKIAHKVKDSIKRKINGIRVKASKQISIEEVVSILKTIHKDLKFKFTSSDVRGENVFFNIHVKIGDFFNNYNMNFFDIKNGNLKSVIKHDYERFKWRYVKNDAVNELSLKIEQMISEKKLKEFVIFNFIRSRDSHGALVDFFIEAKDSCGNNSCDAFTLKQDEFFDEGENEKYNTDEILYNVDLFLSGFMFPITYTCNKCGSEIIMSKKEVEFYAFKNFTRPKKCKSCRDKMKNKKES